MFKLGSYDGASQRRPALRHWRPSAGDANDDTLGDLASLRARSRDLVRNAPLATGALNTLVTSIVGTGLSLQSRIDRQAIGLDDARADAWQQQAEREWRLWCESLDCDATRIQDFYGLQALALRSTLESGDVFVLLPSLPRGGPIQLAVQLIEADRVCNPKFTADSARLSAGVETDALGAPVAYHICSAHPGNLRGLKDATWQRVDAYGQRTGRRNLLHLFDRRRPGQVRGVPMLAPVMEAFKQLGRYTEAELQAAVISGAFSVFVKMDPDAFDNLFSDQSRDAYLQTAAQWDGGMNGGTLDGPGKAVNLLPGESIDATNPGRPNSEFDPFVRAILRQIGVGLEIPFEVLVKSFESSYSASRAALLDAWRFFRGRRDWLASAFCQPIYEAFLDEAIATGRLSAPGYFADPLLRKAYAGSEWVGDGPGSIDPEKEVNAAEKRIALGISTVAAESVLHDGGDWEAKHRQRIKEHQWRAAAGLDPAPAPAAAPPVA